MAADSPVIPQPIAPDQWLKAEKRSSAESPSAKKSIRSFPPLKIQPLLLCQSGK
jgi:hypothetical protein